MSKQCSRCSEMKDDFPHKKSYCRQCGNKMCRDYKLRNKEKIAAYNKNYKEENKDEISKYNHIYNLENRESIQKRQTKNHRERVKKDENFKLAKKYRARVTKDVKKAFKIENSICEELYGCSNDFIIAWFNHLFKEDMKWNNHGEVWSVDHIKPCCTFNLTNENELKDCFIWSNLRPVLCLENQKKTGKLDEELIEEYKIIANNFNEEYTKRNL